MAKSYCSVVLLLLVHLCNALVVGQRTFGDYNSEEQNIVSGRVVNATLKKYRRYRYRY